MFSLRMKRDAEQVSISMEECQRQRARIQVVVGQNKGVCPECGCEGTFGYVTPGFNCRSCGYNITWPEIWPTLQEHAAFALMDGTIAKVIVNPVPMDFVSQIKRLIEQNPSHPLTASIQTLIEQHESTND